MSLGGGIQHGVRPMPSGPICIPAATSDKGHISIPQERCSGAAGVCQGGRGAATAMRPGCRQWSKIINGNW